MFFVLIAFLAEVAALIMAALHRSKLRETALGQWRDVYKKYYDPFSDRPYSVFTQVRNFKCHKYDFNYFLIFLFILGHEWYSV